MKPENKTPTARKQIEQLLERHGFEKSNEGGMMRMVTGCVFWNATLSKYGSLKAFLKDWPVYKD